MILYSVFWEDSLSGPWVAFFATENEAKEFSDYINTEDVAEGPVVSLESVPDTPETLAAWINEITGATGR